MSRNVPIRYISAHLIYGPADVPAPGPGPGAIIAIPGQVVMGTPGPDVIYGTAGPDRIAALGGDDVV